MTELQKQFAAIDRRNNAILFGLVIVGLVLAYSYVGSSLDEMDGLWGDALGILAFGTLFGLLIYQIYKEKLNAMKAHGLTCANCGKTPLPGLALAVEQTRKCPNCGKQMHDKDQPLAGESMRHIVMRLADNSTVENQNAFYRALLSAEVAVPLESLPGEFQPGEWVVAKEGQWGVPNIRGPDGSLMLLVYADQEAALQAPKARTGFWLSGRVVLEMAAANQAGVIVATGCSATSAWAGVPQEKVADVLALTDKPA